MVQKLIIEYLMGSLVKGGGGGGGGEGGGGIN